MTYRPVIVYTVRTLMLVAGLAVALAAFALVAGGSPQLILAATTVAFLAVVAATRVAVVAARRAPRSGIRPGPIPADDPTMRTLDGLAARERRPRAAAPPYDHATEGQWATASPDDTET